MKKAALALATLIGLSTAGAALAEPWFDKYDRNHDSHWTYEEFRDAHRNWAKRHREMAEARWTDAELRSKWDALDAEHRGWCSPEQCQGIHGW